MNSNTARRDSSRASIDVAALAADLRRAVRGEVRFDRGSRALYSTDSSNYRQVPIGVVVPHDTEDVEQAVAVCRRYGAPILGRGGGTSLAGQCCNAAVIIDMSKYLNRVVAIDPDRRLARVQPGLICDDLRNPAQHKYQLTYGPAPATHNHCTFGGMIGNNSCGVESIMAGRTADNVEELEVLTYDGLRMKVGKTGPEELERIISEGGRRGEIYGAMKALRDGYADLIRARYPRIPRRISGYNLDELLPENNFNVARALVGSESTLVMVLEATVRLIYSPPVRVLLVLGYPDIADAGDHVVEIGRYGPTGLEGFDDRLVSDNKRKGLNSEAMGLLPGGKGWLVVEFGGDSAKEAEDKAKRLMRRLRWRRNPPEMRLFTDPADQKKIWDLRESGLGAAARVPGQPPTWPGWEDSAVPPERVGDYLRDLRKLMDKHGYCAPVYGHLGQACIHTRIDFDLKTHRGIANFRSFMEEAADMVVRYGGSLSGEHGDGQARAELLPKMFGPALVEAFREFKSIWDPDWRMNPGKIVRPYRLDENLRLRENYNPSTPETHFKYPADKGSFAFAMERCVGVGKCRRIEGKEGNGTMCPSFMATREEMHSTRGRARLLFEMLQGDPLKDGWRDESVKEALDLCLSCKGCKSDCPVNVDMATYKAEFLSHYYEGRRRPRYAYAFGLIMYWARIASRSPRLANLLTHLPGLSSLAKQIAGMAPERKIPSFAKKTFQQWFRERRPKNSGRPSVILWADTFNNHFHPATAAAAVEVLEAAGFHVVVPDQHLCCGRPLYDYGFLDLAKRLLEDTMRTLSPHLVKETPIVVLEPSCAAVFRDELTNLFPTNENAKRLSGQTYLLSEFLEQKAPGFQLPGLPRKALLHGHCHQKAIMKMKSEESALKKMGVDYVQPDPGCCGMAGAFGFEQGDHYDVSMKVGQQKLIPAVKAASKDTLLIADGFSCREQIAQTSDRQALHLAQVIQMALHDGSAGTLGAYPEKEYLTLKPPRRRRSSLQNAAILGAGILAVGGAAALATTLIGGSPPAARD